MPAIASARGCVKRHTIAIYDPECATTGSWRVDVGRKTCRAAEKPADATSSRSKAARRHFRIHNHSLPNSPHRSVDMDALFYDQGIRDDARRTIPGPYP